MIAEFRYKNEGGLESFLLIHNCESIHHVWYSGRRNKAGRYEKHEVTNFKYALNKLKLCKDLTVKVYEERR